MQRHCQRACIYGLCCQRTAFPQQAAEEWCTHAQGADTVIFERLDPSNALNERLKRVTRQHMEAYGEAGLRTLCLACVELDPAKYDA